MSFITFYRYLDFYNPYANDEKETMQEIVKDLNVYIVLEK